MLYYTHGNPPNKFLWRMLFEEVEHFGVGSVSERLANPSPQASRRLKSSIYREV